METFTIRLQLFSTKIHSWAKAASAKTCLLSVLRINLPAKLKTRLATFSTGLIFLLHNFFEPILSVLEPNFMPTCRHLAPLWCKRWSWNTVAKHLPNIHSGKCFATLFGTRFETCTLASVFQPGQEQSSFGRRFLPSLWPTLNPIYSN